MSSPRNTRRVRIAPPAAAIATPAPDAAAPAPAVPVAPPVVAVAGPSVPPSQEDKEWEDPFPCLRRASLDMLKLMLPMDEERLSWECSLFLTKHLDDLVSSSYFSLVLAFTDHLPFRINTWPSLG